MLIFYERENTNPFKNIAQVFWATDEESMRLGVGGCFLWLSTFGLCAADLEPMGTVFLGSVWVMSQHNLERCAHAARLSKNRGEMERSQFSFWWSNDALGRWWWKPSLFTLKKFVELYSSKANHTDSTRQGNFEPLIHSIGEVVSSLLSSLGWRHW